MLRARFRRPAQSHPDTDAGCGARRLGLERIVQCQPRPSPPAVIVHAHLQFELLTVFKTHPVPLLLDHPDPMYEVVNKVIEDDRRPERNQRATDTEVAVALDLAQPIVRLLAF